ncbi:MAG: sigma 54-interacting transcriptional regulator, partial [Emergencia timonensis]
HAQTKLLRTLETNQITRIGGTKNISVDVRVIAATNRSLEKMIEEGLFREDLYYRLMVLNLTIPPLRERPEDIMPCCDFFMKQAMRINNAERKTIDSEARKLLSNYDWPGNVRELRNVINRVYVMSSSAVITSETLVSAFQSSKIHYNSFSETKSPEELLREKRRMVDHAYGELLKEALLLTNGNKKDAAELLGVSRKTIYNMLEKYKDSM